MLRIRIIFVLGLIASFGIVQAQTPQNAESIKPGSVTQGTIKTEDITLVKDSGINPTDQSPANVLEQKYGASSVREGASSEGDAVRTQAGLDINKIRVITPAGYEQMSTEQRAAVDADPYWIVSKDNRRQVMADVFLGKIAIDVPVETPAAVPVPVKEKPQTNTRPD
jgi:hypothetical protein